MHNLEKNSKILKEKIVALLKTPSVFKTSINGFSISYRDKINDIEQCFFKPITVSLLGGKKHSIFGSEVIDYGKNQTMVSGIDIPCSTQVVEASPKKPYFALILELDTVLLTELIRDIKTTENMEPIQKSVAMTDTDPYIIEAYSRLVDLLNQPLEQQKIFAPIIIREIHLRLLTGPLGGMLRIINTHNTQSNKIAKAIHWIKDNFKENFKVEDLAKIVGMSTSSFHRNFNKVLSSSPIQYQKKLRLYEAQRLMFKGTDVANACYSVGYESTTQFYREYKRTFGTSPIKNIKDLNPNISTVRLGG